MTTVEALKIVDASSAYISWEGGDLPDEDDIIVDGRVDLKTLEALVFLLKLLAPANTVVTPDA